MNAFEKRFALQAQTVNGWTGELETHIPGRAMILSSSDRRTASLRNRITGCSGRSVLSSTGYRECGFADIDEYNAAWEKEESKNNEVFK